jgi:MFS superfamily sulfate permease-like transporter
MSLLKRALLLGVILGGSSTVLVYLVQQYLPPSAGPTIVFTILGTLIAFQWRTWISAEPSAGVLKRLGRTLALTAAAVPISAITAFLIVAMWPGYPAWADNHHRARLVAQGLPSLEIDAAVAQHHQEAVDHLREGAMTAAVPGIVAALATTAVGAVVLRRRPSRP